MIQPDTPSDDCLSSSNYQTLRTADIIASSISFLSSLLVLSTYFLFKELQKAVYLRYIGYLIISNAVYSLFHAISPLLVSSGNLCVIAAYLCLFANYWAFAWQVLLIWYVFRCITNNVQAAEQYEKHIFWGSLIISLILPILALLLQWLGDDDNIYCLFTNSPGDTNILPTVFMVYMPCAIGFVIMVVCFARAHDDVRDFFGEATARKMVLESAAFPAWNLITMVLFIVTDILQNVSGCRPFVFSIVAITLRHSQGLFAAIIYGFNKTVRDAIYKLKRESSNKMGVSLVTSNISSI